MSDRERIKDCSIIINLHFHIYSRISTISCKYQVYSNRITLVCSFVLGKCERYERRALPFHQEEDSRNIPVFSTRAKRKTISRDFRVGHVTRSSSKKLGDISREFPGIPPITLSISALTRPFLRFREDDIREKSDKMGNKKERDIYLAFHDVVSLIPCNEKYRIYLRNNIPLA